MSIYIAKIMYLDKPKTNYNLEWREYHLWYSLAEENIFSVYYIIDPLDGFLQPGASFVLSNLFIFIIISMIFGFCMMMFIGGS